MSDDVSVYRRKFLKGALGAIPLTAFVSTPFDALQARANETAEYTYNPRYFTDSEWRFIEAAVDRLIPGNEDGPGAIDLHVPEFIDRQMDTDYGFGGRWYLRA